ncbi:hypothetical protein AMTR_s00032p00171360 [Amborella trichopoda]|uniref:Transposase MuDR plant domain-containing protein n=1 Tax=Amborella trichopoda TaxID=13333 RepID=U5CP02_AMBTC|nr:hypothetical protein AMTR_s00032p00171360 [Amborella trichopoda]
MTIRYIDPGLSSNMICIDDDDNIANMMEGASPNAMYVSNRPIEFDYVEYQPPIMPDIGPSNCTEYRPPTMPDNDPSRLVITSRPEQVGHSECVVGIGVQDEHESEIKRYMDDIDPIESPQRINGYEVVLQDGQNFDDVHACRNHLIDCHITKLQYEVHKKLEETYRGKVCCKWLFIASVLLDG